MHPTFVEGPPIFLEIKIQVDHVFELDMGNHTAVYAGVSYHILNFVLNLVPWYC
jgi:hypothetical protein